MNRIWVYALILALLGGIAYYLSKEEKKQSEELSQDRDFTIKSVDELTKFVVKRPKKPPMVFEKIRGKWILNEKYNADPIILEHLLSVFTNIRLSFVPPKSHFKTVKNSMNENGIQIDLYTGGNSPSKIYTIGNDAASGQGTYMWLSGANQPFVMQLKGLHGGVRSRFEHPVTDYISRYIYDIKISDIESLKMEYKRDNFSSYIIEKTGTKYNVRPLLDLKDKPETSAINQGAVESYLTSFSGFAIDKNINNNEVKDSILALEPLAVLTIQKKDGDIIKHEFLSFDDFLDKANRVHSQKHIVESEKMFLITENKDLYVIQNRAMGEIFRQYNDFFFRQKLKG